MSCCFGVPYLSQGVCFASLWIVLIGDMFLFFFPPSVGVRSISPCLCQGILFSYCFKCCWDLFVVFPFSFSWMWNYVGYWFAFLWLDLTCLLSFALVWSVQFGLVSFKFICRVNVLASCLSGKWMFVISLVQFGYCFIFGCSSLLAMLLARLVYLIG
jgi:hypothetical protein